METVFRLFTELLRALWRDEPMIEDTGKSGEISPGQNNENANAEELPNHSMA